MKIALPPLSFGAAAIAGLYTAVPAQEAADTVRHALDAGLTYIDTAPHYGLGVSEERLRLALADVPRDSFVVSTKVGRRLVAGEPEPGEIFAEVPGRRRVWDWSTAGIRASVEESLIRLGLDRLDIAYLHDPDDHEAQVYETAYPALAALRDEGVVRAIGAGMNQTAMLTRFVRRLDLDVVLCAGRYSLLDQSAADDLLPACLQRGVSVVIGGVYNGGLLAGGTHFDYQRPPPRIMTAVRRMRAECGEFGVPLRAAALQFPGRHPAVTSTLVGCRTPAEVDDNVAMFSREIPDELWERL